MAVAAGGLLGFAVLVSGLWHPKLSSQGGLTQVGRRASITYEDGSVLELTEPESDLDILRRRRMAGWGGHDYRQTFIKSDGTEVDLGGNEFQQTEDSDELDTGDHLIFASYRRRVAKAGAPLDKPDGNVVVADLHVEGKDKVVARETDPKDRVVSDVIDSKDFSKDEVFHDSKEVVDQPVFALTTYNSYADQGVLMALMGDPGSMWGNIRTVSSTGLINIGGSGGGNGGGSITTPPIGTAVPEPSTWALVGVAGVAVLAAGVRRSRRLAR